MTSRCPCRYGVQKSARVRLSPGLRYIGLTPVAPSICTVPRGATPKQGWVEALATELLNGLAVYLSQNMYEKRQRRTEYLI
jgi:hypothetical protein